MVIYLIWSYDKWPHGPFPRSFPIMTCRLLFPTWLLPTMTLAIICRNGPEPFERTLLTVLTVCLYHPSSSILHSLHFPPFSFIYLLLPSFSSYTFHFLLSLTFILIHSTSFNFTHTHCMSLTFNSSTYIGLPNLPSSSPISLLPPSFTFIYLH